MAQAEHLTSANRVPITGASAQPSTNPVRDAYAELIAGLAGHPPRPMQRPRPRHRP